jgi:thiol-disulfide isomerase/thioredoxin
MSVITVGTKAPPVPGVDLDAGTRALFFYKVTCPVCQMVAPLTEELEAAYPGTVAVIGQDPDDKLGAFAGEYGWSFDSTQDAPPYDVSEAYGIRVVPTFVMVSEGNVVDVVESWDRDAWNGFSSRLAELTGRDAVTVSREGDELPSFRPG